MHIKGQITQEDWANANHNDVLSGCPFGTSLARVLPDAQIEVGNEYFTIDSHAGAIPLDIRRIQDRFILNLSKRVTFVGESAVITSVELAPLAEVLPVDYELELF